MKLVPIDQQDVPEWKAMREQLYRQVHTDSHAKEMAHMLSSDAWHCQFITDEENSILGFVEISLRNIVDGCKTARLHTLKAYMYNPNIVAKG